MFVDAQKMIQSLQFGVYNISVCVCVCERLIWCSAVCENDWKVGLTFCHFYSFGCDQFSRGVGRSYSCRFSSFMIASLNFFIYFYCFGFL